MAADFTVVINALERISATIPRLIARYFVGKDRDFAFDCPDVDTTQTAVLMFQSLHVDHEKNVSQLTSCSKGQSPCSVEAP